MLDLTVLLLYGIQDMLLRVSFFKQINDSEIVINVPMWTADIRG